MFTVRGFLVVVFVVGSAACTATTSMAVAGGPYAVDAAGRRATVAQVVPLSWLGNEGSGLILNAEVCDGQAYLLAPALKFIQVADLTSGIVHSRIGKPGNGPEDLRRPVSIGLDCSRRKLYVVEGPGGVLAFNLADGQYQNSYPHSAQFRSSMGARTFVSKDGALLTLSGIWSPRPGAGWEVSSGMFEDHQIGLELPLGEATGRPLAAAYERGCGADLTACLRVDVQPLDQGGGWVVAHGGSTRIGVLAADGALRRTIDIRSPEFRRDGKEPGEGTEAQVNWGATNSTVWGLYAVGDIIAVVHVRGTSSSWQRGQVVQFHVFMNLYSLDGDRLVSDIRLPGLPVGRDRDHLLVVDYGASGRRSNATEVLLVMVPVREAAQAFQEGP